MIYYILKLSEIDPASLSAEVSKLTPRGGETVMSTATRLREEGKTEGKIETARKMRKEGLPNEMIARVTGLSPEELQKL